MTIEKASLWHLNLLEGADLSADYNSDEAPRAADRDLANPWESVSIGTQHLKADFGTAVSIAHLVLGNHNLNGVDITLQHSPNDADWTTADSFTPSDNEHLAREFTSATKRYWRIKAENASVAPQIGEWWLCNGVTVFPQFLPGLDPHEKEQSAVIERGVVTAETRERYNYREYRVKLDRTTKDFADTVEDFFRETGPKPFWFDWDGDGVPVFVRLAKPELRARGVGKGRVSLDISLEECLSIGAGYDSTEEKDKRVNEPVFAFKLELFNKPIFGRATGGSATTLVDSSQDFIDLGVEINDRAYNDTDGVYEEIASIGITSIRLNGTDAPFVPGDKYVIRAKTWSDDPNMESFWLTQEALWPGCMPIIKKLGAIDKKIDFEKGTSIVGGFVLDLMEVQQTNFLQKLMARKYWDGAKVHLYQGYKTDAALTADDLDFSGTYVVRKATGSDRVSMRLDSFQGQLLKPAHQTAPLFQLWYQGDKNDRIEISVDGVSLRIYKNDDSTPFVDYDLTDTDYENIQKVREALDDETEFTTLTKFTEHNSQPSSKINDLDRVRINNYDGIWIIGLQTTYTGAPQDAYYNLLTNIGIPARDIDYYDIAIQMYWVFDWYIEQRPSLEKDAFTVIGDLLRSCGGWMRTGLKRDITGSHDGSNNSATLEDTEADFSTWGVYAGDTVYNLTDGCSGVVTNVAATILTFGGGLSGGTDDDFDTDDEYRIEATPREVFSCRILAPAIPGEVIEEITTDHIIEATLGVNHKTENYAGRCQVDFDYDPREEKYMDTLIVDDPDQEYYSKNDGPIDKVFRTIKLKAPWLRGAGAAIRAFVLADRRLFWQRRNKFSASMTVLLNRDDIEPADMIRLSHEQLPSIDGAGFSDRTVLVTKKTLGGDLKDRKIAVIVEDADFGGKKPFIIAPDGTPTYADCTDEQKEKYGHLTNDQGIIPSDGSEGKVLY